MFRKELFLSISLLFLLVFSSCSNDKNSEATQRPDFGINGNTAIKAVHHEFEWNSNYREEDLAKLESKSLAFLLDTIHKIAIFKDINENPDIYRKWYLNGKDINENKAQFSMQFSDYGVHEVRLEYEFQKTTKLVYVRKKTETNVLALSESKDTNTVLEEKPIPSSQWSEKEETDSPIIKKNDDAHNYTNNPNKNSTQISTTSKGVEGSPLEKHLDLGKTFMAQQNYKDALKEFNKVLSIDSNHGEAKRNKKVCEQSSKQSTPPATDKSICNLYPSICQLASSMIKVKAGNYYRGGKKGAQDERPVRKIDISQFYISKYEVTQQQWQEVMGSNPSAHICPKCPVENITHEEIKGFLFQLSQIINLNYRLPTEAEWEYAAIGGIKAKKHIYSGSETLASAGWTKINSKGKTHPIGTSKKANALGICDMTGNVSEWCGDWYQESYYKSKSGNQANPLNTSNSQYRVIRGGNYDSDKDDSRLKNRSSQNPNSKNSKTGFRLVRAY